MQPELCCDGVDREPNPERDTEELPRFQMCERAGGEKYTHHWPRRSDTEQYSDCPSHPPSLQQRFACAHVPIGARQGKEKETVEEKYCGPLHPSANGIGTHGVGRQSHYGSQRKQQPLCPRRAGPPQKHEWR